MKPTDTYSINELQAMAHDYMDEGATSAHVASAEMIARLVDEGHDPLSSKDATWDAIEAVEANLAG